MKQEACLCHYLDLLRSRESPLVRSSEVLSFKSGTQPLDFRHHGVGEHNNSKTYFNRLNNFAGSTTSRLFTTLL
jgi:hypothetical protein